MQQEIVSVNLSTDGQTESGETLDIIIDQDKAHMVNGQSLCRTAPNGSLLIVRNPTGKFLMRHGERKSENPGVSLTSYLFGKLHMRRHNIEHVDDYTTEAYKTESGRPAAIDVMRSPESSKPVEVMYADEFLAWSLQQADSKKANQPEDETMTVNPNQEKIDELNTELIDIKARIAKVREVPASETAQCACCGKDFVKAKSISLYCSSINQDGKSGCKEKLNARQTTIRARIKELGGEVAVAPIKTKPTTSQSVSQTPADIVEEKPKVKEKSTDVFKTIGGVEFTLAETKDLLMSDRDQQDYKDIRGIKFSLSELRKLVLN